MIFAAEPYESISFKIPNVEIETAVFILNWFIIRKVNSNLFGIRREKCIHWEYNLEKRNLNDIEYYIIFHTFENYLAFGVFIIIS